MSWVLVKYVLTAAVRDRLVISLLILLALVTCLAVFIGSGAIIEQDRFVLVFAAGGLRLTGVFGLVLFSVFHIRRSFDARDVEFILSRPVSRVGFLLSHAAAFSLLALFVSVVQGICIYVLTGQYFHAGCILWIASMMAENMIMVNAALFFSLVLSSAATSAMAAAGFYVLARLMGQILGIIDSGGKIYDLSLLEYIMQVISMMMPRLDLMGQTSWLVYGMEGQTGFAFIFAQGIAFTGLILAASYIDLKRRQF